MRAGFLGRLVLFVFLGVTSLCVRPPEVRAQALSREVRTEIISAVVEIRPWDATAGAMAPTAGSGTIISPDGYIITNFHVIGDTQSRTYHQEHAVYMTRPGFADQAPEHLFWATHIASDPTHDLALLRIHQNPDESPVDASLRFPSVPVGNSNDLLPGDGISIIGYPGISGQTITFTAGLMGGWVGEDLQSGGKQWIKTDAKIAHGNSGGAAVNNRGELVGVPTAGRTIEYDRLDVEEQAYVRPIALAWSLIGPNVANVRTADGASLAGASGSGGRSSVSTDPGLESGSYGEVAVGSSRSATIATGDGSIVYNTYTTTVGPNTGQITIRVDGGGLDVDMAVKAGSEIESYDPVDEGGDYDFLDASPGTEASYTYTNPDPGTIYIDVMNLIDQPIAYTVDVQSTTGVVETSRVDPATSGTVGQIGLGETVSRQLSGMEGSAAFHTYYVDVPAGARELVIEVRGDQDFDVAVKHGSTISSYAALDDGGDWDYQDVEASNDATIVVSGPAEGRWYIDVYEAWTSAAVGSYVLTVR